jgi:hypothetical protein
MALIKKVAAMVVGAVVVAFLLSWVVREKQALPFAVERELTRAFSVSPAAYPDTDGDGFADWEEALAGTGAMDAGEAPRVHSPAGPKNPPLSPPPLLKEGEGGGFEKIELPVTGSTETPSSLLHTYGNALAAALAAGVPVYAAQAALLERAAKEPKDSTRVELGALARAYEGAGARIAALVVPEGAGYLNTAIADSLRAVGRAVSRVAEETTGITDGSGWSAYSAAVLAAAASLRDAAAFFASSGVRFDASEPGSIFNL